MTSLNINKTTQANVDGLTPIALAAENRHGRVVEMLLRKEDFVGAAGVRWTGWRPHRRSPHPPLRRSDVRYGVGFPGRFRKLRRSHH